MPKFLGDILDINRSYSWQKVEVKVTRLATSATNANTVAAATPQAKPHDYSDEIRQQAVKLYVDGLNFRRIARHLDVHHQTVINWINAHVASLPDTPLPDEVDIIEQDELFTFIGEKKRDLRDDDG